jgi:hypothetical protein
MLAWLFAALAVMALIGWWIRRRERPRHWSGWEATREPIDYDELERAEREVRDDPDAITPDDEIFSDDWGPGTGHPRPPERL